MEVELGDCPYLPERRFRALLAAAPETAVYRRLLDANCRRMGAIVYQPRCEGCRECRQLRVDAVRFAPSRSQRRCRRRNADLRVSWHELDTDDEHADLLDRYQRHVHDDESGGDIAHLVETGGIAGGELQARDPDGRLLAVSVVDRFDDALSSVYCYYDPSLPRHSLGTFMALAEIDHCREHGLAWLYLGYHVAGCGKMRYKAAFAPHQVLDVETGEWAWDASSTA